MQDPYKPVSALNHLKVCETQPEINEQRPVSTSTCDCVGVYIDTSMGSYIFFIYSNVLFTMNVDVKMGVVHIFASAISLNTNAQC